MKTEQKYFSQLYPYLEMAARKDNSKRIFTMMEKRSARIEVAISWRQGKGQIKTEALKMKFMDLTNKEMVSLRKLLVKYGY